MRNRRKKRKKEDWLSYIKKDDKMVGLGKFVEGEKVPVFVDFAMGYVVDTFFDDYPLFVDKISNKETILPYKVFEDLDAAKEALEDGYLKYNEVYCYSIHDVKLLFPKVLELHTKKEVQDYLLRYNEERESCLNWTFMDEEEKKILRKEQNRKYIK